MTVKFMEVKIKEYDELKKEVDNGIVAKIKNNSLIFLEMI